MDSSWKRIIYLICTIQVGGGITIIGVLSFLPLFLAELGLHDPGEAAMWAGLVSGVTPCMVALSAPYRDFRGLVIDLPRRASFLQRVCV